MKVKVGSKIYDGEKQPVMVILTKEDKKLIADMAPDAEKYCSYPDTEEWIANDYKKIKKWMKLSKKKKMKEQRTTEMKGQKLTESLLKFSKSLCEKK